ncbi:hypothetical protein HanIR_Chr12g0571011 [Helianthus annuus]|nr:hypothetical protein HanIR_Chr12g0571011 [Helianthus annuus]
MWHFCIGLWPFSIHTLRKNRRVAFLYHNRQQPSTVILQIRILHTHKSLFSPTNCRT